MHSTSRKCNIKYKTQTRWTLSPTDPRERKQNTEWNFVWTCSLSGAQYLSVGVSQVKNYSVGRATTFDLKTFLQSAFLTSKWARRRSANTWTLLDISFRESTLRGKRRLFRVKYHYKLINTIPTKNTFNYGRVVFIKAVIVKSRLYCEYSEGNLFHLGSYCRVPHWDLQTRPAAGFLKLDWNVKKVGKKRVWGGQKKQTNICRTRNVLLFVLFCLLHPGREII